MTKTEKILQWFHSTADDAPMTKPEVRALLLWLFEDEDQ